MAEWTTAYVNDLPDSAFLYIEPGGDKDETGRTVPRSLRHFPYRDASGSIDLPHLRNALARIPQSSIPASVKDRISAKARRLLESATRGVIDMDYEVRTASLWPDVDFELRAEGDNDRLTLHGYAAVFDKPSQPLQFPGIGGGRRFREVIKPGAFTDTLAAGPDITLRYQHNLTQLPLARTKSGTMTLEQDDAGLRVMAMLPDNEWGRPVRDAVDRGDISGMSFRFHKVEERWSQEGNERIRYLHKVDLSHEVSVTDMPAYLDTSALVRQLAAAAEVDESELTRAIEVLTDEDDTRRLSEEEYDALQKIITVRYDGYQPPRLARARERLSLLVS